jgi:hypothetical protein
LRVSVVGDKGRGIGIAGVPVLRRNPSSERRIAHYQQS